MRAKIIFLFLLISFWFMACQQSVEQDNVQNTTTDIEAAKALLQQQSSAKPHAQGKTRLSAYGFFDGELNELNPAKGVIPYDLNTPLFSDYAHKSRFFKLPAGSSVTYREKEVLDFPVGTYLIKNFFYFLDDPDIPIAIGNLDQREKGRRLIETRLLLREADGWKALPSYIWNDEQTEAFLTVEGGTKAVTWINESGEKMHLAYSIPSQVLCKSCHIKDKELTPIGPKVRQLNRSLAFESGTKNQLMHYADLGLLTNLPPIAEVPKTPVWNKPASGDLHRRALAYLDINCAHCHNPGGPGNTSALHLSEFETNDFNLGINKHPVAAGKGTGGRPFDIVKGHPEESILVYRMESTNPGEMMPEVARKLVHQEGVDLIKEWIKQM